MIGRTKTSGVRKARSPVFRVHTLRFKLSSLLFLAALVLLVAG
jgi:hypothetical protein